MAKGIHGKTCLRLKNFWPGKVKPKLGMDFDREDKYEEEMNKFKKTIKPHQKTK